VTANNLEEECGQVGFWEVASNRDLERETAHLGTSLAWSQSCRGTNHLAEKSATVLVVLPLELFKKAERALSGQRKESIRKRWPTSQYQSGKV